MKTVFLWFDFILIEFWIPTFSCKTSTWSDKNKIFITCHHNFPSSCSYNITALLVKFWLYQHLNKIKIYWWSLDSTWWYYILVIMFGLFLVTSRLCFWNFWLLCGVTTPFSRHDSSSVRSSDTVSIPAARVQCVHVNRRVIPQRKPDVRYRSRAATCPGV